MAIIIIIIGEYLFIWENIINKGILKGSFSIVEYPPPLQVIQPQVFSPSASITYFKKISLSGENDDDGIKLFSLRSYF